MTNLWRKFNLVAIISGILISLILTLFLKFIIGNVALWFLPIFMGLISIFLVNETEILGVVLTSIVTGLISYLWIGYLFIILAPLGGCIAAILNNYLSGNEGLDLSKRKVKSESRVKSIENWISNPQTNKLPPLIVTLVLVFVLIWGIGLPVTDTNNHSNNLPSNSTPKNNKISPEQVLENNVKKGLETFFTDFNKLFNYDGVNNGYLIKTMKIDRLKQVSINEVNVTASLTYIDSQGNEYDSKWSGALYLENGKWVDKGNFVQILLYNINTGENMI